MAKKRKKTPLSLFKKFIYTISLILIVVISYFAFYINQTLSPEKIITIPKGSTQVVIESLQDQGFDVGVVDFLLIKYVGGLKYGKFKLDAKDYSRLDFFESLQDAKSMEIDVTLIPGETLEIFLSQVAQKNGLSLDELKKSYSSKTATPDGVIFADTYTFKYDIKEEAMISYLLETSRKKHKELSQKLLGSYDEDIWFGKYVVMASIIQKEAVNSGEMPLVSSVIYNRLAKGMPLQMDGSLNYGLFSHKKVTPERIRTDNSTYNTYKNRGLPNYPVCAVSKEALVAAVNPAKTDYLYFMRNTSGVHTFTNSFSKHNEVIESVKKSNKN